LEDLFAKAKELGLKVLLDLVPNHTSDEHQWFIKSANRETGYENFYVWKDCEITRDANNTAIITKYPNNWVGVPLEIQFLSPLFFKNYYTSLQIAVFHTPAWSYNEVRGQCYLHQFVAKQPDLNYRNEDVVKAMTDVLTLWLERGADGFR
jgi:alpha-glucosidase